MTMEQKQKDALGVIEDASEKLIGLAGLFKLRGTTDDLVLEPMAVEGIQKLLRDIARNIFDAQDVLCGEEVPS